MIEVEIKLPVKDLSEIAEKLKNMGFSEGKYLEESDIYFNSEFHNFVKTGEAFRIRRVMDLTTGEETSLITYKGPRLDSVTKTRQEIETSVGSGDDFNTILNLLGFTPVSPVVKQRRYMHRENLTACLDTVNGLGSFLELEIIVADDRQREDAVAALEKNLSQLGYSLADTVKTSYLGLLQQKMNRH